MKNKKGNNWIKNANIKKGALTEKAKKAGETKKSGGIKEAWVNKVAENKGNKYSKKTEKQAQLAKTFKKIRKKK